MKSDEQPSPEFRGERTFLTAGWYSLAMLNYGVDPALLTPHLPAGTELDPFEGRYYLSLVAFRFVDTRVLGFPVPLHRNFDEINLRFYVRRGERRGVVFIKEIVPKAAIAAIARFVYNEPYVCCPTRSDIRIPEDPYAKGHVRYEWRSGGEWQTIEAELDGFPRHPSPGTQQEFITEHYWGYTPQRDGGTLEYHVTHPRWRVWDAVNGAHRIDVERVYGAKFVRPLEGAPFSAFVAEGSPVAVYRGRRIV